MIKIFKSLLMIVAVGALATGATSAYFTSEVSVDNMSFATGTFEITDTSADWMKHVEFSNLKPGDTIRKWVTIQNTGSLDVASLTVGASDITDDGGLLPQIKLSIIGQVSGHDNAYYTPNWTGGATVNPFLTGSETNLLGSYFYSGGTPASVMAPGETDTIILDFAVPSSLDNSFQGVSADFDLDFHAEQSHTGSSLF